MRYAYLTLAVVFNVGAYAVFKSISGRPYGASWLAMFALGLALGGVNTFFFATALRELKLAVAYPVFAGASIAAVVLMSAHGFGEEVTLAHVAGAGLVLAGIVVLTR